MKLSWVKLTLSFVAFAGAAFFFWRASQVGLSNEKIGYTVVAVFCGVVGLLSFIFSRVRSP